MAQALKITFVDGDTTISEDRDLIYYANAFRQASDQTVKTNYENCLKSQIKSAYDMSAESWELIQYQPVQKPTPVGLKKLIWGM